MAILDELLVELGFEYDPKDIEKFNDDLDNTINMVKKLATALVAGTVALTGFTTATTAATDKQGKLSKQTGVSVEEIDALTFALQRSGGEASGLATSLEQFSIRISEAARGTGSGIEAFGILGISITDLNGELKSTDQLMLEVADALQGFDRAQQIELADKLGLRDSILLLQEGSDGIKDLTNQAKLLGTTTAEDAALSEKFQDSLTNILQIGKQLARVLTRSLVPVLENVTGATQDWWFNNREIIEQKIPEFVEKTTKAIKFLTLAAITFIGVKLVTHLLTLIKLFKSLSVSAALANATVAVLPTLIGALVTAIALLAEDALTFFEGGESFIGDMIQKYPQWAGQIKVIAAIFATLGELTSMIFKGWGLIFDLFTSGDLIGSLEFFLKDMVSKAEKAFEDLVSFIDQVFSELWTNIVEGFNDLVVKPITSLIDKIKSLLSFGDSEVNVSETIQELVSFDLPSISDIIPDIPSMEDISLSIPDLPEIFGINLQGSDDQTFSDLIDLGGNITQDLGLTNPVVNPNEISNNNNSASVSIGDLNVQVSATSEQDAETTGQIIGESIRRELEPILRQASQDLNSVVEF